MVIGCPDYFLLMKDRARLSKLKSWTDTSPPGSAFLGSRDFPADLAVAVEASDPAGVFLGSLSGRTHDKYTRQPSQEEKNTLIPLMTRTLKGKRILNLAGADDKLVPYSQCRPFLQWLKTAIGSDGWFKDSGIYLKDVVFEGVGHAMPAPMMEEAVSFLMESLEQLENAGDQPMPKI